MKLTNNNLKKVDVCVPERWNYEYLVFSHAPTHPWKKIDQMKKKKMKALHAASPNVILKVRLSYGLCVVVALNEKLPQAASMQIAWMEDDIRNRTAKVWGNLDNPIKRYDFSKVSLILYMSPSQVALF